MDPKSKPETPPIQWYVVRVAAMTLLALALLIPATGAAASPTVYAKMNGSQFGPLSGTDGTTLWALRSLPTGCKSVMDEVDLVTGTVTTLSTPFNFSASGGRAAVLGQKMVMVGTSFGCTATGHIWVWDMANGTVYDTGVTVSTFGAVELTHYGGRAYIAGRDPTNGDGTLWSYKPGEATVTKEPGFPTQAKDARFLGVSGAKDQVLLVPAWNATTGKQEASLWRFDLSTLTATIVAAPAPGFRIGWWDGAASDCIVETYGSFTGTSAIHEYNTTTLSAWNSADTLPATASTGTIVQTANSTYIVGFNGTANIVRLDPPTSCGTSATPAPTTNTTTPPATTNTTGPPSNKTALGCNCTDFDGDGIANASDDCVGTADPGQEDADADGVGDVCDNCRETSNWYQADANQDGVGDACEPQVMATPAPNSTAPAPSPAAPPPPAQPSDDGPSAKDTSDSPSNGTAAMQAAPAGGCSGCAPPAKPDLMASVAVKSVPTAALVAAGSVGALGAAAVAGRGTLAAMGVTLISRIRKDSVLAHPMRMALVDLVQTQPGIHYSALKRELGLARGNLEHHLQVLYRAGLLWEERAGQLRMFYPPGKAGDAPIKAAMRSERAQQLRTAIEGQPGLSVAELAKTVGCTYRGVAYHIERLQALGLTQLRRDSGVMRVYPAPA